MRAQVCRGGTAAQEQGAAAARQRRKGWCGDAGHARDCDAPGGGAQVQAARAVARGGKSCDISARLHFVNISTLWRQA
jgi:hypothetical protein